MSGEVTQASDADGASLNIQPAWFDEFTSALSYAEHVVLSGNVRDVYPAIRGTGVQFPELTDTLSFLLASRGITDILTYDPVDGLRPHKGGRPEVGHALELAGISLGPGTSSLPDLSRLHATLAAGLVPQIALVVNYATHLHGRTPDDLQDFFIGIDRASRAARQSPTTSTVKNPTIWIVDHPADLPDWFVVGNDQLREIQLEYPNLEDRFVYASRLAEEFAWSPTMSALDREKFLQQFALECEGETLIAMRAIARISDFEGLDLSRISDAIRIFRTGSRRNPWNSPVLFSRVREARARLEARVKGQPHAIEKTLDILARSIMGLSGSQSGPRHAKPRGVLFFAGPTGVGKTELAKAVTDLLFGDETACQRFDMSEFMEEDSISRLIGAPPGHPGHERGGELVNAANRHPFSVFLFDEIEKAHPRILDMFLQILDEGRLTDSRGASARFSQALIIFTSNIGIVRGSSATNKGMNVLPSDTYGELDAKITTAVQDHFRSELRRPELVSRIGQNIVVFNFLSPESASLIFESILGRVLDRVTNQHGIRVELSDKAHRELKLLCIHDYFDGGRGIGNRVETHFINPLARSLFGQGRLGDVRISDVIFDSGVTKLVFEEPSGTRPGAARVPAGSDPELQRVTPHRVTRASGFQA